MQSLMTESKSDKIGHDLKLASYGLKLNEFMSYSD